MFEFLFGKKNPTRDWEPRSTSLTFDLDTNSLNGVPLGSPLESVSFMGPDEDRHASRQGKFCYYSAGVCIDRHDKEDAITSFHLVFHDPLDVEFQPYKGQVLREGRVMNLASLTTKNCEEQLGEYYWLDDADDETILFYSFPECEWQIEFDPDSSLKRMVITNDPIMTDAVQREAYGVTKPMPSWG